MDKKYRFGTCFKAVLAAVFCAAASFCASAFTTNYWTNATGDNRWDTPGNWSLRACPVADDFTILPNTGSSYSIIVDGSYEIRALELVVGTSTAKGTVTFTGNGSILSSGVQEDYLREKRALILDGPSLTLTGNHCMLYGPMTVKNGSVLKTVNKGLTLWKTAPALYVQDGGTVVIDGVVQNNHAATVEIDGGNCSFKSVGHHRDSTKPMNIRLLDGTLSIQSTVTLSNSSSLTVSGGKFSMGGALSIDDTVTLDITGGVISLSVTDVRTVNASRLVTENKGAHVEYVYTAVETRESTNFENLNGGTIIVNSSSDIALNLWPHNGTDENGVPFGGKVVNVDGTIVVSNGCLNFKREGYICSDYPIFLRAFRIDEGYELPTIGFPEVIIGKTYPFISRDDKRNTFYLEGPTTFRATADVDVPSGIETFLIMSGDCTVDTANYYDSSVSHKVYLYGLCAKSQCALAVCGGGELVLKQAHAGAPFTRVEVAEGTTLTLANLDQDCNYGPLHTDELVLGPNSVLNIPAGFNSVRAGKWTVDPTARVNVMFADGLATDAIGLMYGASGSYRIPESQITVTDASAKWSLAPGDSCWIATNSLANLASQGGFEWTGNGSDDLIGTLANWYCGTRPTEKDTYVFGAANAQARMKFHRVYRDTDTDGNPLGSTVKAFKFRNTATTSFTIYNGQPTLSNTGEYSGAGVFSESTVPQYVESSLRAMALHSLCAASEGPLVFTPNVVTFVTKNDTDSVWMRLVGDIRFGATIKAARIDFGQRQDAYANRSPGSRLTILDKGNIIYTNQYQSVSQSYTGFRVEEGGVLTFNDGSGKSRLQWATGCSANHTVDGTMNVNVPYFGGGDQSFGGKGEVSLHSLVPSAKASKLELGGSLTVNLPARWPTVTAAAPGVPLTLKAYGSPVIMTEGDWAYGMFDEIASPAEKTKRAAEITRNATLTFNPNGGTATFSDPLSGKGTVAIENGTLYIPGGVAPSIGVKVCDKGKYEYDTAHELRSLVCEAGSTLRFAAPITVKERVNLDNVSIEWAEGAAPVRAKAWKTLFVSKSGFDGELSSIGSRYYARVAETANGFEYQVRPKIGAVVTFR